MQGTEREFGTFYPKWCGKLKLTFTSKKEDNQRPCFPFKGLLLGSFSLQNRVGMGGVNPVYSQFGIDLN